MRGRMRRAGLRAATMVLGCLLMAGCPEIGRVTYRFDLGQGAGSLSFEDIGTDDPSSAQSDFAQIVNEWVLGSKVQDEHPTWRVGERKLFERDGRLDGQVLFTFDSPSDAGLYQHNKKSPYLWCASQGETVISTNGTVVPQYPSCVMFERKTKVAEVTVTSATGLGSRTSLVEQFRSWDGGRLEDGGGLSGLGEMFGEAMRQALGEGNPLGQLLPDKQAGEAWTALGLPVAGGTVVTSTEVHLQVAHSGMSLPDALARYGDALRSSGYTFVSQGEDETVWSKGEDKLTVVATQAGGSVIVSIAR